VYILWRVQILAYFFTLKINAICFTYNGGLGAGARDPYIRPPPKCWGKWCHEKHRGIVNASNFVCAPQDPLAGSGWKEWERMVRERNQEGRGRKEKGKD